MERQTLTLAYSDDPSRVMLLWAITNKKVTSPFLDVQVSFLPVAQIIPAANTKQYDAIEATPLAVPRTAGGEPGFQIISSGLLNLGGTILYTGKNNSAIKTPADLKGKTVAVASLGGTFVQESRYVLTRKYGLNTNLTTGEVKFAETPQESVLQLLRDNRLDGAVLTDRERAVRYLALVGLAEYAERYPAMLSGGERQRVALARALAVEPAVIYMDEPFSALDATTRTRLREELRSIWRAERRTIVFVTHDTAEADTLATRVLELTDRPARIARIR